MWVSLSLPLLLASCLTKRPPSAEASVEIEAKPQSSELIEDSALKALLDEHWAAVMERYPEWASRLGDHRYDRRVTDKSLASLSAWRARLSALEGRARALQLSSPADQLSRDLLVWELGLEMARERCKFELWAVSARDNALVESNRLAEDAVIQSDEDAANLVERYRARAAAVRTEAENLSQGAAMGLVESKDSVAKVIAMLREELSSEIAGSPLSASSLPGLSEARRGQLRQVVADELRPALAAYLDTLEQEVLPEAREGSSVGLHALPDGDACYQTLILEHTTLDLTPDALHETGLQELARIHEEIRDLGERVFQTRDLPEIFERLRTDPALRFRSAAEIRASAESALRRAESAVPSWFEQPPRAPCAVDLIPDYLAPYTTVAYYDPVRADGRKYGVYFVNVLDPESRPRHEAEVLAFHESVPGHHLQIALAQEQGELPAFRRHGGTTAFLEGWALYAERLADEMGLYSGDTDRLGMLSFDTWRAARLVVDTGVHAKGWTREQAERFMIDNTPLALNNIRNEVDRYITTPGQALAYKVGQLEIRAIRERSEAALGERFDIRAFHQALLSGGPMPMPILRDRMERWQQERTQGR